MSTTEERMAAAIGVLTAARGTQTATDDEREALVLAAYGLLDDLFADGRERAAVAMAKLVDAALWAGALASGVLPDVLWQQAITRVTREMKYRKPPEPQNQKGENDG